MNKNCYRLIFNKARRIIMAVSEVVTTKGKSNADTQKSTSARFSLKSLTLSIWALTSLIPLDVLSQVIVDNSAPANQRPTVSQAANGVPMVNIQTPNKQGISHNTYRQFDVNQQGVILNNSRQDVQTQLGGWINGNASLANGSASTILNEINSQNPSLLNGYIEVAGQQAHVIIANPAGITCNGCGFINANQTTLTTGKPQYKNGNLNAYLVERGQINFEGQGLDDRQSDYTNVIARSIEVNANLWANQLNVSTGAGAIDTKTLAAQTNTTPTTAPTFALDVSELGGMYAQKITLVGNEHGVGVRNAGTIGATAGNIKISSNGTLENIGQITSNNSAEIKAQTLNNRGLLQANNTLHIDTHQLNNQTNGRIYGEYIAIESHDLNNHAEEGEKPVIAAQQRIDLGIKNTLLNANGALIASLGDINIGATLNTDLTADTNEHAANIINRSATVEAQNNLNISAQNISNLNDQLEYEIVLEEQRTITEHLNSKNYRVYTQKTYKPEITTTNPGKLIAGNDIKVNVAQNALNQDSHILAGRDLIITGQTLTNQQTLIDTYTTRSGTHYTEKSYEKCWSKTFSLFCEKRYRWVASNYNQTIKHTKPIDSTVIEMHRNLEGEFVATSNSLNLSLIDNALFQPNLDTNKRYIVETDPAFTNHKKWLSSDYMLTTLGTDPSVTQKRLGDGFYEQKVIREQVSELTGKRFLGDYQNDEMQYADLMKNAIDFAQEYKIKPGIALTGEQMEKLTSNIVWLVEQDITLADGTTTQALVPQVYVSAIKESDLNASGSLLSANNINVNLQETLHNSGQLNADNQIQISAQDIEHQGKIQATDISAFAENDLTISGGNIQAQSNLILAAGNDLNIESTTSHNKAQNSNELGETAHYSNTEIDQQANIQVTDETGQIKLLANNDLNIKGAKIQSEGDLNLQAKNIDITTVETKDQYDIKYHNGHSKGQSTTHHESSLDGKNVQINAQEIINITGSTLNADNDLTLHAQAVLLNSAHNTQSHDSKFKDKGFFGQKHESQAQGQFTQVVSTELQANNLQISTHTLQLVGSTIEAEIADIEAEMIKLISDKDTSYENAFSDSSNILTRTIKTKGQHKETAVESAIQASKLIVNDQETIKQTLDADQLIARISSEHPELSNDQIELIQANLTNKEWNEQITTLSETGAILVQAVVTYLTAGAASGVANSSSAALNAAVDAAIQNMIQQATTQAVTGAITGNYQFDLNAIAEGAIKSGITAGFDQYTNGLLAEHKLNGLKGESLSLAQKAATQTALYGGDFKENLTNTLVTDLAAKSANAIGDKTDAGSLANISSHAALGCGAAAAQGQDCASGAAGGALSATLAPHIAKAVDNDNGIFTEDEVAQGRLYTQLASTLLLSNTDLDLATADQAAQNELDNNLYGHVILGIKGVSEEIMVQVLDGMVEGKTFSEAVADLDYSDAALSGLTNMVTMGAASIEKMNRMAKAYGKLKKSKQANNVKGQPDPNYTPNAGGVANTETFLKDFDLGKALKEGSSKTHKIQNGARVYKVKSKDANEYLSPGDQWYLDTGHNNNHIEVYGANNKFKHVLNLDGSYNYDKTKLASNKGRKLPK